MAGRTIARKRRAPDAKIAVGYLRISTTVDRQALGTEAQRVAIEKWALASGVHVAASFVEEVSGGSALHRRPVLLEAIASVAAHGAAWLVCQRLDRFSRDPLTAILAEAELQRHGAALVVADGAGSGDDPTAQLVRGILFSVAQFEKKMISARIKAALSVKRKRGELTGVAPYGWRAGPDGKLLEPHPEETAVLAEVRAMRASGMTLRAVLAAATSRGLVGRTGKPFTLAAMHAMIRLPSAPE